MTRTFCIALAVVAQPSPAVVPASPQTPAASTGDPRSIVDAFHDALRAGKRQAALVLLADDVLVLESGGAETSKAEYEAAHLDADMEYEAAVRSSVIARQDYTGDAIAWVATEGHSSGTFRGKSVNRMTAETMVLRRFPEGWRIVHIHWSSSGPH